MDEGTAKDYIEDLQAELAECQRQYRTIKSNRDRWRRVATQAFEMLGGHVEGCRRACMCTCGYEHMQPLLSEEEREKKTNE
jgi:hypothetical protein